MPRRSKDTPTTATRNHPEPIAMPVVPLAEVARLWNMDVRKAVDALKAHGVPIARAPHSTVALVRLADLERLFPSSTLPNETTFDTVTRVTAEPMTADDVLRSVGLRRRSA